MKLVIFLLGVWTALVVVEIVDNTLFVYGRSVAKQVEACESNLSRNQKCSYEVIAYPQTNEGVFEIKYYTD